MTTNTAPKTIRQRTAHTVFVIFAIAATIFTVIGALNYLMIHDEETYAAGRLAWVPMLIGFAIFMTGRFLRKLIRGY